MDETIPKKRDFLVPALPLIEEVAEKAKTTDVIEFLANSILVAQNRPYLQGEGPALQWRNCEQMDRHQEDNTRVMGANKTHQSTYEDTGTPMR